MHNSNIEESFKVSIIIPSYNRSEFISETLESVLQQTYKNWECIIVDDGSTDNSFDIINSYIEKDKRFKIFFRDRGPKGACTCRNIAVEKCDGDYLIFLDTDDLLEPFCCEQRVNAMTEDLDFAIFPSLIFRHKPFDLNLWWNIDKETSELKRQFYHDAIAQGTGALWKKDAFVKLGLWDEVLLIWQDIDLFFRAYIRGFKYRKFFNLPPDLHIRRLETSLSRSDFFNYRKQKSRERVIKQAAELLIIYNKPALFKELKYMTVEVITGFFRSKYYSDGNKLLNWAVKNNIVTLKDLLILKLLAFNYVFKLKKLGIGNIIEKMIIRRYIVENSIGKVKYKE